MKCLVVSADDLGLHPGLNGGIIEAHRYGIVTATSIVANGTAFRDAVARLRAVPDLDVGIHLTLVGEAALLGADVLPTLAPEGRLPDDFGVFFRRLLRRQIHVAEIERELEAQMALVRDHGIAISHADGHQHMHLHPAVLPIVLRLARRFAIRVVRAAPRVLPVTSLRATMVGLLSRRASRQVVKAGLRTPDVCVGVGDSGRLDESRLVRIVETLPAGVCELVCHPGLGTAALAIAYPGWGFAWDDERQALQSPRVRAALERAGVALTSYRAW